MCNFLGGMSTVCKIYYVSIMISGTFFFLLNKNLYLQSVFTS